MYQIKIHFSYLILTLKKIKPYFNNSLKINIHISQLIPWQYYSQQIKRNGICYQTSNILSNCFISEFITLDWSATSYWKT